MPLIKLAWNVTTGQMKRTWLLTTLRSSFGFSPPPSTSKSKHCWRPRSPRRWRSAAGSWCETSGGAAGPPTTTPATAAGREATCCAATTVLQPSTSSAGQSPPQMHAWAGFGAGCGLSRPPGWSSELLQTLAVTRREGGSPARV